MALTQKRIYIVTLVVGLFIIAAFYLIDFSITEVCDTSECFTEAANQCKSAQFLRQENVGTFIYLSRDCLFTKALVNLSDKEPQAVKDLLEEKSLTCVYEKGSFDGRWLSSLMSGTENCVGELKDLLNILTIFT